MVAVPFWIIRLRREERLKIEEVSLEARSRWKI